MDVLVYVSQVQGNDTNDGSAAQPVQTIEKACSLVPPSWDSRAAIVFSPGTYSFGRRAELSFGKRNGPSALPLVLLGGFQPEVGKVFQRRIVDPILHVSPPTNLQRLFSADLADVASGDLVGAIVTMKTGAFAGQRRMVRYNTAKELTLGPSIELNMPLGDPNNAPAIGDTFVVERPAVTIEYSDILSISGGGDAICLQGIRFRGTTDNSRLIIWQQNVIGDGCEFDLRGVFEQGRFGALDVREFGALRGDSLADEFPELNLGALSAFATGLHGPTGCYIHDGLFQVTARSRVTQYFVFNNVNLDARRSDVVLANIGSIDTSFSAKDASVLDHSASDDYHGLMRGQCAQGPPASLVSYENNSISRRLTQLDISGAKFNAVQALTRSFINVGSVGNGRVQNRGFGINVFKMSQALIDLDTTVSGALGETLIGTDAWQYDEIKKKGRGDDALNRIEF